MFPGMPIFSRQMPELSSEDMAKMSDSDLLLLEKQGREGIEFRIQTIQRIQVSIESSSLGFVNIIPDSIGCSSSPNERLHDIREEYDK